uniref:Uncharacterized protein n=1 Tax=Acrobeloides nanus TaxID=290746 RepID=A0A914CKS0_9BILA
MARVIVIRNDYHDYERPKLVSPTSPTSPTRRFQYATTRRDSNSRFKFDNDVLLSPPSQTRRFQYATTRKNSNSRFNPDENDVELPSILACRLQNLGSYKRKQIIPEFTSRLDDQWHHHDDTIILKIGFKGFPAPNVTW